MLQKNIAENLEVAYEYNPAHFFQVVILPRLCCTRYVALRSHSGG